MAFLCKRLLIAALLGCALHPLSYSQAVIQNKRFSYYLGNYSALNPSHIGIEASKQFNGQYLSYTGIRSIIKTFYVSGYYTIPESKFSIGLSVYSEHQGRFLQDNNFATTFAFRLFENEEHSLQAGGNFGAVNYLVKDNDFGFGGGDWGVDGGMGLWYQRGRLDIGLAYVHLFNTKLAPVNEQFILDRSLNLQIGYDYDISVELKCLPMLIVQQENNSGTRLQASNQVLYRDKFIGLITYHSEGMIAIGGGFENINVIGSGKLGLVMNFNINLNNKLVINSNQYEIGLRYYWNN